MQSILVIITFAIAAGFILKKFVWNPIFESNKKDANGKSGCDTGCGSCH